MFKQYTKGGQRRTIEAGCGWRCVGHPQEVNKKYDIHKRHCNTCKESKLENLPEFDKTAGLMNGWKGITNRNQQPNQMLTTAYIDGERQDIFVDGAKNIEEAMDDARLTASILAEKPKLSKSQKKRQKQKAKKQVEEEEDFTAEEIADFIMKIQGLGKNVEILDLTGENSQTDEEELNDIFAFMKECKENGDNVIFAPL